MKNIRSVEIQNPSFHQISNPLGSVGIAVFDESGKPSVIYPFVRPVQSVARHGDELLVKMKTYDTLLDIPRRAKVEIIGALEA